MILYNRYIKNFSLLAIIIIIIFLIFKLITWFTFFDLVKINSYKDFIRIVITLSVQSAPINQKIKIDNETYLIEDIKNKKFKKFINEFPIPKNIIKLDEKSKIIELRKWVFMILPEFRNKNINLLEPESSYEILLKNKSNNTFSKICSADTKIFSSYLSELGILHRILQLENHIGLEIYNKKNQEWEFHDVHFNDSPKYNGKYISASFAYELTKHNKNFDYNGPKSVFNTIIYLPKTNLVTSKKILIGNIDLNYFRYDNLSLWKPILISEKSSILYKDLYQSNIE